MDPNTSQPNIANGFNLPFLGAQEFGVYNPKESSTYIYNMCVFIYVFLVASTNGGTPNSMVCDENKNAEMDDLEVLGFPQPEL